MPVAILLDLLTRTQRERAPGHHSFWLSPVRRVKGAFAPYGRMREVAGLARQHGLLHLRFASRSALESPDLARRLRRVFEDAGGMLVKFGQVASTRGDILPPVLIAELSNLRADVKPFPADQVREVLEAELGAPYSEVFSSFDWTPLAAASIGQTHRATLTDGTRVVVKVQRPEVRDIVIRDAAVLRLAATQLERRVEAARIIGLAQLCEELIIGIEDELDYQHEANLGMRLRDHRSGDVGIAIPKVYEQISTGRVLVMDEVIDARSIADEEAVEKCAATRHELAEHVLASFIGQVLEDGLFHADPHPGNLLVDASGTIWLLDFGSVGRLSSLALSGLRGIALGFATNDASILARAARDLAGSESAVDLRSLEADLAVPLADLDSAGGFDPAMIGHVLTIMQRHDLRPPASITLLGRSLVTLEGTLRVLEPGFSMVEASKDVVKQHRDAFGTPREILQHEVLRLLPALRTLPEHAEAIAGQLRAGSLTMRQRAVRRARPARRRRLGRPCGARGDRQRRRGVVRAAARRGRRDLGSQGADGAVDPRLRRARLRGDPDLPRCGTRVATPRRAAVLSGHTCTFELPEHLGVGDEVDRLDHAVDDREVEDDLRPTAGEPGQPGTAVDERRTCCPRTAGEHRGDVVGAAHRCGCAGLDGRVVRARDRVRIEQRHERGEVAAA